MDDFKTVEGTIISTDPLLAKQREDVAKMRASLLACSEGSTSAVAAIRQITVLRVYHQMTRIIKYLEMMDKIEEKLYESIDKQLDKLDSSSAMTWMTLLNVQERLQKNMLESHKLLQPYLESQNFNMEDIVLSSSEAADTKDLILNKDSREKLRVSAQQVLLALGGDADDT